MADTFKYCDLVMKGGVTSGIVYPNAVLALAREYRFKNIGGTSAGAIAAAVSAAAAMGERIRSRNPACTDVMLGFAALSIVAKQLTTRGFIYRLFQPAAGARNAYRLLVIFAGRASFWRKLLAALVAVLAVAPLETLAILGALCAAGCMWAGWPGVWAALPPSLLCAWLGGSAFAAARVARVARGNLLGLCSGLRGPRGWWPRARRETPPALTDWLHGVLQDLSGKPHDQPLTFADLHDAPRYDDEPKTRHAINLQMITTAVSHHEPRTLPFEGSSFWFLSEEFERLFPASVVDWMVRQAGPPILAEGRTYHRLPTGDQLPVLVGTRMSLSFPLLISAVPLHEPARWATVAERADAEAQAVRDAASSEKNVAESMEGLTTAGEQGASDIVAFRVCWFSDGGIGSNFPIHLFDAALPLWPTFAINLVYPKTDDRSRTDPAQGEGRRTPKDAVYLPTENNKGWQRTYQSFSKPVAFREVAGFLFGIVATMQNWRDLLQSRAPGQRDRIVHVSLEGEEGGMNLDMPQEILSNIAAKGTAAGERFREFSFENHYWIRWRNLVAGLQHYTIAVANSGRPQCRVQAYASAYALTTPEGPLPPSYRFSSADKRAAAEALLQGLCAQGEQWDDLGPDLATGAPRPMPQLKIVPTY